MLFRLKNGPSIFQRVIDDVLRVEIGKTCYVYMDDVIIFGKNLTDHLINLDKILKLLNEANLNVQLDKSEFLHSEIEFLDYVIGCNGIKPSIITRSNKQLSYSKNLKRAKRIFGD